MGLSGILCEVMMIGSGSNEWKSIQQRVPIKLTACHLGGVRP
jgi:hypothetical protein